MTDVSTAAGLRPAEDVGSREGGAPSPEYEALKFRFGFLCLKPDKRSVRAGLRKAGWIRRAIGSFELWTHPETRVASIDSPGRSVVLLGEAYHLGTGAEPTSLGEGDEALLEFLDDLGGRFALLVFEGDRARVFHDPIGSRSVFYHAKQPFAVASHALLLARAIGAPLRADVAAFLEDPGYRTRSVCYLPGDLTPWEGIYGLIPNHVFDSASFSTPRYWPRAPLAPVAFENYAELVDRYFAGLAAYVGAHFSPVIGLTGGADSRLLLAAFRAKGIPFETVTWRNGYLDPAEVPTIERIASHLSMPHRYLDRLNGTPAPVAPIAGRNGGGYRGACRLAQIMYSAYPAGPSRAFIRGYGAEIMRGFYNTWGVPLKGFDPVGFARAYFRDRGTRKITEPGRAFVRSAFAEFHARGDYAALEGLGYDPNDIFYWEHRMGMWASATNSELDVSMPILTGLNSRPLYAATFGLPRKRRLTKRLFLELTERYDPVLARIPLAPTSAQNSVELDAPHAGPKRRPKKPGSKLGLLRRLMRRLRRRATI